MLLRHFSLLARNTRFLMNKKVFVRNSHAINYREGPKSHSKATLIGSQVIAATMWWWILWHLWHEHEHITGEFEYPDPSLWTNEELGIPPLEKK